MSLAQSRLPGSSQAYVKTSLSCNVANPFCCIGRPTEEMSIDEVAVPKKRAKVRRRAEPKPGLLFALPATVYVC